MNKKRFLIDNIYQCIIAFVSLIGLFVLIAIFSFIISKGNGLLNLDLLTGDYYEKVYNGYYNGDQITGNAFALPYDLEEGEYFSSRWGIALKDDLDKEGKHYILITYIDKNSVLTSLPDKNNEDTFISLTSGEKLEKIIFSSGDIMFSNRGAEAAITLFDSNQNIIDIILTTSGKGIRGSLITTLYLIGLTLLIALPIGVLTAIYLHEFSSSKNKLTNILRRLVEMLTGVPSIIFGLLGAAVFVPFVSSLTAADGGNLISGSLTLAVIILPVIISSTEETLKTIPNAYREASLALGATKSQTTFRVVLKTAIPGILSAVLLSVGRIIGESAALIYAIGTSIKDQIIITEKSTSLAVHIWTIMNAEVPNFELASAISIIILILVLFLSLTVKLVVKKITY